MTEDDDYEPLCAWCGEPACTSDCDCPYCWELRKMDEDQTRIDE